MFEIKVLPVITYMITAYDKLDLFSVDCETSLKRKIKRKLKFFLFFSFPVVVLLGSFEIDDSSESLYLVAVSICASLHVIRFHNVCTKMGIISVLLKETSVHSFSHKENFIATEKTIKNFNFFSIGLIAVTTLMVLLVYVFPIVYRKTLPFKIWFPLDWKRNEIHFWIAYAYIMYCIFICYLMIAFAILTWYVLLNIAIKYRMLGNDLENLGWYSSTKPMQESEKSKLYYEDFVKCVGILETLKWLEVKRPLIFLN